MQPQPIKSAPGSVISKSGLGQSDGVPAEHMVTTGTSTASPKLSRGDHGDGTCWEVEQAGFAALQRHLLQRCQASVVLQLFALRKPEEALPGIAAMSPLREVVTAWSSH